MRMNQVGAAARFSVGKKTLSPPPYAGGGITPSLVASRSSGAIPLAIHFDATGTTSSITGITDTFRQLYYSFDYGDTGAGTWVVDGASKETDSGGPIGAHVYELSAGSKTVTLTVTLGVPWATAHTYRVDDFVTQAGNTYKCLTQHLAGTFATDLSTSKWVLHASGLVQGSTTTTVTPQDADTVFSGTNTVCVDPTGGTTGGPAGAQYVTSMPTIVSNKRYLVKRGQSIAGFTVPRTVSGVRVGAYGTGIKPICTSAVAVNDGGTPSTAVWAQDVVVADLNVQGGMSQNSCGRHVMFLRCDLDQAGAAANNSFGFGSALFYMAGANGGGDPSRVLATTDFYQPKYVFLVDCYQRGDYSDGSTPLTAFYGSGDHLVFMGNDWRGAAQHTIRITNTRKGLLQHNKIEDRAFDNIRLALKLHASGPDVWMDNLQTTTRWRSNNIVIRSNIFGAADSTGSWTMDTGPQSGGTGYDEGLIDIIIEGNTYVRSPSKNTDIICVGDRITTRNNVRADAGVLNISNDQYFVSLSDGKYDTLEAVWGKQCYGQFNVA